MMGKINLFSVSHLNIRGLTSKYDQVKAILLENQYSIFCLSETFLNEFDGDNFFEIPGYVMVKRNRKVSSGGGLLCYVQNGVSYEHLTILDPVLPESITLLIKPHFRKPFIVSLIYRPPNKTLSWNDLFCDNIEQCLGHTDDITILGDFNINLLDRKTKSRWNSNILSQFSLHQLIDAPTRVTENTGTLIDHIYVTKPEFYSSSGVTEYSLSDHFLIFANRNYKIRKHTERIKLAYHDYSKLSPVNITKLFSNVSWDHILWEDNIDSMVDKFSDLYQFLVS